MAVLLRASRWRIVAGVVLALSISAACVDLFHSTDYDTLCTVNPSAPACGGEGGVADGSGVDASDERPPVVIPQIDFCTFSAAEARQKAERTCAWVGACEGPLSGSTYGQCMVRALAAYDCNFNPTLQVQGEARRLWACLVDVNSCGRVRDCLYGGRFGGCPQVGSGSFIACEDNSVPGNVVVECGIASNATNPPQGVESCLMQGRGCYRTGPSTAACSGSGKYAPGNCPSALRCESTYAMRCAANIDVGINCAYFGSGQCVADDAGVVACAPADTAVGCTSPTGAVEATCDDAGVASRCVRGKRAEARCGSIGLGCVVPSDRTRTLDLFEMCTTPSAAGAQYCTPLEDGCKVVDGGSAPGIESCGNNTRFALDCAAVGLGPCREGVAPKPPFASCTPPAQ